MAILTPLSRESTKYNGNVCDSGIIQNGGFETGDFPPWVIDGHVNDPVISTAQVHGGAFSALAGNVSGPEPGGDSSFYQQLTVPAGGGHTELLALGFHDR